MSDTRKTISLDKVLGKIAGGGDKKVGEAIKKVVKKSKVATPKKAPEAKAPAKENKVAAPKAPKEPKIRVFSSIKKSNDIINSYIA